MNNKQLQQMAASAIENWIFDDETDPGGAIKRGLEYLAADEGDWDDEIINARLNDADDWDGLERWAGYLGTECGDWRRMRRRPGAGPPRKYSKPAQRISVRLTDEELAHVKDKFDAGQIGDVLLVSSICDFCEKVFRFDSETCRETDTGDLCSECTDLYNSELDNEIAWQNVN